MKNSPRRLTRCKVLGLLTLFVLQLAHPLNLEAAAAQTPPFYQGKTIRIIVGYQPGD